MYGGRFNAATVPFIAAAHRNELARDYANARGSRALAIHRNGGYAYRFGEPSPDVAKNNALRNCNQNTESNDCFLYDVNGEVQFTRDTPLRNPG